MKRPVALALSAASALALGACAQDLSAPGDGGGITLHTAAIGSCNANENRDRQFPSGSDRIVLELSGGDLAEPFVSVAGAGTETAAGEVIVTAVPPGAGMTLRVVACNGADTVWAGETHDVDVYENLKSFPSVFLTPTGAMACTGTAVSSAQAARLSEPRAFAALAADADHAYVFGGFSSYSVSSGAEASQTIDRYDRVASEFSAGGGLKAKRGMAHAHVLSDGRVRVFGGTTELYVASGGTAKPALYAPAQYTPSSASEIYDPATGISTVEEAATLPAAPAGVTLGDVALAIGGVEDGGVGNGDTFSGNVTRFASEGASSAELAVGRFGATVVALTDTLALVWGGNVDADPAHNGVLIDASGALTAASFTELTVNGATDVPIFAAGAMIGKDLNGRYQVVIAGGNVINAGPLFPRDVAAARLDVLTVDVGTGTVSVVSVDTGELAGALTRAAGSLEVLGDGSLLWYGGFTAFQSNAICGSGNDCIQSDVLRFTIDGLGSASQSVSELTPSLELSVGPLGANAVALGDGSWLFTGGIETITQTTLAEEVALARYGAFSRDLCGEYPLPTE
ncbi:MAG: hypothetical protein EP329_26855 [Deltaproteobacteria bacterium]|nr:MAG: hypothetical protein EP329_26855 [Deltaproteobacteria bacterium]